jgi:hypothetical protein
MGAEFVNWVWRVTGRLERGNRRRDVLACRAGDGGRQVRCDRELTRLGVNLQRVDFGPRTPRGGRLRKWPAEDDAVSDDCREMLDRVKRGQQEEDVRVQHSYRYNMSFLFETIV